MEHEYTITGRIFPELTDNSNSLQQFTSKISWVEQDFENFGLKIERKEKFLLSMKSEDLSNETLEQACLNLSVILGCKVCLCKDHEVYGVANVFNGGSDYEVVDEDCFLWVYEKGVQLLYEQTKTWNEKFTELLSLAP